MSSNKKKLGQFYTTNYDYILQNMKIPVDINVIVEPFAGNGDLLNFIHNKNKYTFELYDIDPKKSNITQRDTLLNPPCYDNKFVFTNPPYLARNKNKNKEIYDLYNSNDLYKCFITNLIHSNCSGGIIIVPLNFISSMRTTDISLRKSFIQKFHINIINIFEEQVFDDTKYAVCSILFNQKYNIKQNHTSIYIYPSNKIMNVSFNDDNNYTIGGEIFNIPCNPDIKIERATKFTNNNYYITNILLKCIDDNIHNQICLKIVDDDNKYIDNTDNLTARSYATLVFNKKITLQQQSLLVDKFNYYIREQRDKYNSLFLTNYRESNTIARKRISFDLAFKICNYLLSLYNIL